MRKKVFILVAPVLCGIFMTCLNNKSAFSQPVDMTNNTSQETVFGGAPGPAGPGPKVFVPIIIQTLSQQERDALEALRESDPEAFREAFKEKIKTQAEYLKAVKEKDPEAFRDIMSRAHEAIERRHVAGYLVQESLSDAEKKEFQELRQENHERFKSVMKKKIQEKEAYLSELQQTDPQGYEQVTETVRGKVRKKRQAAMLGKDMIMHDLSFKEREALQQLKDTDPDGFREAVKERFKDKKAYLDELRQEDPQRFKEEIADSRERIGRKAHRDMLGREILFETLTPQEKEALARLRQEDPEGFHKALREKIKEKKEYLDSLKETDPEKAEGIVAKAKRRIHERIEQLRRQDPEKFKELLSRRKNMQKERMKALCDRDPERCRQLKEHRKERLKTMLRQLREEDPDAYHDIEGWIHNKEKHDDGAL